MKKKLNLLTLMVSFRLLRFSLLYSPIIGLSIISNSSYAQIVPVAVSQELTREDSSFIKHLSSSVEVKGQWKDITSIVFKYKKGCMLITYYADCQMVCVSVENFEVMDLYYIEEEELIYYPSELEQGYVVDPD